MVEKQEIPSLVPTKVQSPEIFVEDNLGFLKNGVKKAVIFRLKSGFVYNKDVKGEYKSEILKTTEKLKELLPYPIPRSSKKLDFAVKKYVDITSSGHISICGREFVREDFSKVFVDAYKNLGFKYGGMFINKFMESYNPETVDNSFWNLVSEVRKETNEITAYHYAKWYYYIKNWENYRKGKKEVNNDYILVSEKSFLKNFLKVYRESGYKNSEAFSKGVLGLIVNTEVNNFDNYAYLTINASESIPNPKLAFWTIDNLSVLEQEQQFDYAPSQFLEDTKNIVENYGEKVAFSFVYGVSGAVKKSQEYRDDLEYDLFKKQRFDKNPNWLEEEIKDIDNSHKPEAFKKWGKENLLRIKKYEKNLKEFYIPQKQAEMSLYNPELFRNNFLNLLKNLGIREARLYSQAYNCQRLAYYSNSRESDIKFLVDKLPIIFEDLKKSVSKEVYDKTIGLGNEISHGSIWILRNFLDGVRKSYLRNGEEETIKRIIFTRNLSKKVGGISGLERKKH